MGITSVRADTEVVLVNGALSLTQSWTRIPAGTVNCRSQVGKHVSQSLTYRVSTSASRQRR